MAIGTNFFSFQVALTTGGTAQPVEPPGLVAGAENPVIGEVYIKPLAANTGALYIGGPGVTAATGFEMVKTDPPIRVAALGLARLYFNGPTAGDKLSVLAVGP